MKYLILVLLAGCTQVKTSAEWETAPAEYSCTEQQSVMVQKESTYCIKETNYLSTYCYGTAFIRNCTKKGQP